jgi:release factor glutamine methyltransferase
MKRPNNIVPNDWRLLEQKYKNLDNIINKVNKNYPVQYLIGYVDFFGYRINVNENVLIPRYETETLVEKAIKRIDILNLTKASVLEIGTGSGCISVALKNELKSLEITAIDISHKAINVAKKNAKINKCKINFVCQDMFKYKLINNYDVLISNPPYIKDSDVIDESTKYEPKIAIYGGKDGLKYYDQIFKIATKSLNKKHLIALEIDEDAASELKKLAKNYFPNDNIKIEKDLANKDRFIFISPK